MIAEPAGAGYRIVLQPFGPEMAWAVYRALDGDWSNSEMLVRDVRVARWLGDSGLPTMKASPFDAACMLSLQLQDEETMRRLGLA